MQSQDLKFLRPSLSNALHCMSLIVPVQAPDRTILSWESCYSVSCPITAAALGSLGRHGRARAPPWTSFTIQSLLFCLSVAKPLEPTFAARLSRKNKSYKWKTRAVKWQQLCVFNIISYKRNSRSVSFFFSQRQRSLKTSHFHPWMRHFQVSTVVSASSWGCLFPHWAEVWFHFGRGYGSPFSGILS